MPQMIAVIEVGDPYGDIGSEKDGIVYFYFNFGHYAWIRCKGYQSLREVQKSDGNRAINKSGMYF